LKDQLYSILIPVYNSEDIVKDTVGQIVAEMTKNELQFEIVLVNDGSPDNSWEKLVELSQEYPQARAINLLKNYGQHSAVICAMANAKGDYMVTMDDDLQNPPAELIKLIEKINEGYDLVFAKFHQKKHSSFRKLGTNVINYINGKVFHKPKDITLTNFRIFKRKVAERAVSYKTNHPYIPGLLLMHASKIANVYTEHHARQIGTSNYSIWKILTLVSRLLFNYSSYPLRLLSGFGLIAAAISFLYGAYILIKAAVTGIAVPGWTTIIVMLAFFNGILILMLGVMGVYISRTLQQVSNDNPYHITEILE